MQKIRCVCPCCGEKCCVSVEVFTEMEKFALLRGQIIEVLDEEPEEGEEE